LAEILGMILGMLFVGFVGTRLFNILIETILGYKNRRISIALSFFLGAGSYCFISWLLGAVDIRDLYAILAFLLFAVLDYKKMNKQLQI
jgi:hypothetical protein